MSRQPTWRSLFLSYLIRPSGERPLYREAIRRRPRTFLEMGIGTGTRAARLIEIASWSAEPSELEYTGIDLFESRNTSDGPGTTLKGAYQMLHATGVKMRLLPGTARGTLRVVSGSIRPLDFIVASSEDDLAALAEAAAFLPRILHSDTKVFLNHSGSAAAIFRQVPLTEIHGPASERNQVASRAA